ncbi:hypothetical protein ACWGH2_20825 [Streptomyces sp. NPDC054871]
MTTATTATTATAMGTVKLFVPQDWFDLLEDGADRDATRRRCTEIVQRSYPTVPQERQAQFVDALMAWYEHLLTGGTVLYGIASGPLPGDAKAIANWQVMAGVVDVPAVSEELDIGALLAASYGSQTDEPSYQESFTTDLGIGFGAVTQSTIQTPPDDGDDETLSAQIGVVRALTCPPGGGKGILFVGVSLDPSHVGELAGLLAVMAHRSTFGDPAEPLKAQAPPSLQESTP